MHFSIGQGIAGWVAGHGQAVNLMDAYKDPRFDKHIDQDAHYTTRSLLTMPLRTMQGRILAVLQVINKKDGLPFQHEDEILLEAISAQASIFLENANLYQELLHKNLTLSSTTKALQQRNHELDILLSIEQQMSRTLNLEDMLHNVLRHTFELLNCESGWLVVREHHKTPQVYTPHSTLKSPQHNNLFNWSIQHQTSVLSNQPAQDPRFNIEHTSQITPSIHSLLCVPLHDTNATDAELLGALTLINKESSLGFQDSDLRILSLIAARIGHVLQTEKQREKRQRQGRLANIGNIVSGILHDIKTPLTLISGYAQLTANQKDIDQRLSFAETIQRQVERIA
ncbi:MAG: GAF domain-containing protein, partial [Myxococcota bacterium]